MFCVSISDRDLFAADMLEAERPTQKKTTRTYIAASSRDADGKRKSISAAVASICCSFGNFIWFCAAENMKCDRRALLGEGNKTAQLDSFHI